MTTFVLTSKTIGVGTTWSAPSTAPGYIVPAPTIAGTISSGSDLTPYTKTADVGFSTAMQDVTTYASAGYTTVIPGLTTGDDIVLEMFSDFAASQVWIIVQTTLGGLSRAGSSPVYVDVKNTSAARGATNPSFVGAVYLSKWSPAGGSVGSAAVASLTLTVTGQFTHLVA